MRIIFSILVCSIFLNASSQDNLFSLKSGNVNHFNPALVGTQSDASVILQYRNQWQTLPGSFIYTSLLSSYNINEDLGVGLELSSDVLGDGMISTRLVKGNVNYNFDKKQIKTRIGLNLGYRQSNADLTGLRYEEQIDPDSGFTSPTVEPFVPETSQAFLIDFGIVSEYKNLVIGLSAMQFNQPNVSLLSTSQSSKLPTRLVAMVGYSKEVGEVNLFGLATFQTQNQFTSTTTQISGQYKFAKLGLGVRSSFGQFRIANWFIMSTGIQFDKFSISYNYDVYNQTDIRGNLGTHEISAAWYIKGLKQENSISTFINGIL